MAKMSQGLLRRKTRALGRSSGTITVRRALSGVKEGERVVVRINARYPGAPHPKFMGRSGVVAGHRGRACIIRVMDGDKEKVLVVMPVHLSRA